MCPESRVEVGCPLASLGLPSTTVSFRFVSDKDGQEKVSPRITSLQSLGREIDI